MKELILLLKESLSFYRETLGHPDPSRRPPTRSIVVIMFVATLLLFAYSYSSILVEGLTTDKPSFSALESENQTLRIDLIRLKREHQSCVSDRDDLLASYTDLIAEPEVTGNQDTPYTSTDSFYDRLEELN